MSKHQRLTESEKHSKALTLRLSKWYRAELAKGEIGKEALLAKMGVEMRMSVGTVRNWVYMSVAPRSAPAVSVLENFLTLKEA